VTLGTEEVGPEVAGVVGVWLVVGVTVVRWGDGECEGVRVGLGEEVFGTDG
jgi:hypothetical protein